DRLEGAARKALGETVFGGEHETLHALAVRLLRERGERVTVAESCTGGLLGAAITSVPGSSDVYDGGVLTYANRVKTGLLGVEPSVFETHGAVSEPCARAMAEGALRAPTGERADHALALTGIAGPGGGSDEKPVGTVFIGYARRGQPTVVKRFLIAGDRDDVRARSVVAALGMLTFALRGVEPAGKLLWEIDR
ncbi:MAG: nicotinamide-nucleotide amidohydrolase family protein, partial [Planctomycetota bacterium]